MANQFKGFLSFVEETTGHYPKKLRDSFRDIYIYVPGNKVPPKAKESGPKRTVSITNYFSNQSEDFRKLVYSKDWNLLEHHLGSDLLRFCFNECIFAKRTKAGAFMVSNLTNLHKKVTAKPIKRLHEIFHCTAAYRKENPKSTNDVLFVDLTGDEPVELRLTDKPKLTNEPQNDLDHLFYSNELEISTDDMLYKIAKSPKFPNNHILVEMDTKTTMSSQVIRTKVGHFNIAEYTSCLRPMEAVLQKFKKAHNRYGYDYALNDLIDANRDEVKNFHNQLSVSLLEVFFRNILQTLIPKELFHSNKNINILMKVISDLLRAPKSQSISLKSYMKKMKITDVRWLNLVNNIDAKWCIFGKLLKWFFDEYILVIFRCMFYIMVTNSYEKIYFKQNDWKTMTSQFLRKMRKEKVIANTKGLGSKISCNGRWTLFPKKNGMRPIMSNVKGSKPGAMTRIALCYLQQLHMTKYGETGKPLFFEKWRNLVDKFRNHEHKTVYLVSCDIEFAYGSIDQKKLLQIVKSLAEDTGPEIILESYQVARDFKAVRSGRFRKKNYVTYPEMEMPIASDSIFAPGTDKPIKVSKEILLRVIHQNIRNQNILMSNQKFLLQKGIAQGAILSSVLCDLYYSHMEETCLSEFKNEALLHRYVDDFLFATVNEAIAERFLEHVNKGFPEYNCSFNMAKTRTNLPGQPNREKHITYLGFNIHPKTLEVTPEYAKSARYTTLLSKPRKKIIATFHKRLMNLASLKLEGIILDCRINSEETILENVKQTFTRQAERCLWLLKALFDDIPSHLKDIYRIIKLANREIIIRVQRYFLANGYDFKKLESRLVVIPWAAYRQVFGKQPIIHAHFRSLFLVNKKMSQQAAVARQTKGN